MIYTTPHKGCSIEGFFGPPPSSEGDMGKKLDTTSLGDIKIKKLETRPFQNLGTLDSPKKHGNVKCFFIHDWEISEGSILESQE